MVGTLNRGAKSNISATMPRKSGTEGKNEKYKQTGNLTTYKDGTKHDANLSLLQETVRSGIP